MRIGVDASCWANGRGYGRFTRELLRAMVALAPEEEWVFFLDASAAERFDVRGAGIRLVEVSQGTAPARAASADGYRSPVDMLRLTRAVWRERPDVFFSPSVYTYFPLPPGQRAVVAIHDAIAERFPELTLPTRRARLFWNAKVRLAVAQARLIVTVSEYSARELGSALGIARERIRVVSEAPAAAYRPSTSPLEVSAAARRVGLAPADRWFVYVGGFNPHKRVDTIVRAHARAVRQGGAPAPHLLLVGSRDGDVFHGNVRQIEETIAAEGTEALVHWVGFVEDEQLRHLHSGAVALCLVSDMEGFGLPAVEAAACGAPVIATTRSPLPELLEGGGIFIEPSNDIALADAMLTLLQDDGRRCYLGARGRERAETLSWDRGARTALHALREVA